jgi:bifunctional DNA-binding transcriptional regulator/antitoxin component of YhaV-PrlF toxin-antitoxin module
MSYYIELTEDENGDLIFPIPEEVIETLCWKEDDLLTWDIKGNGIILQNLSDESNYEINED